MSTYTKHITDIGGRNRFTLSVDLVVTKPDIITSQKDCYSIISFENPEITYIGKEPLTWEGTFSSHLRFNALAEFPMYTTSKRTIEWTTNDTLASKDSFINSIMTRSFDDVDGFVIQHDETGKGIFTLDYTLSMWDSNIMSGDLASFYFDVELEPINMTHVPGTIISSSDKQSLIKGTAAIKTKLIINNYNSDETTLLTADTTTLPANNSLVLDEENAVKSWELCDERYVPNDGFIGQFVARTLSGELHNIDDTFNIENKDVELQIGVVQLGSRYAWLTTEDDKMLVDEYGNKIAVKDLGDDITTWYSLGNFLVTKPEDNEVSDNTKFEAFDYAIKFNVDFDATYVDSTYTTSFEKKLLEDTVTAKWLAQYTCAQVGIEFATDVFTNDDFIITSNQFTTGDSCRDVMKAISELAFGWCRIGWDNKCYIDELQMVSVTDDDENTLTNDNYYSLITQKELFGPVNRVVIGMSAIDGEDVAIEDTASIEQYGLTEISIMDNPILYTEELRNTVVDSAQKLFGLYYTPMETETPGHPWFNGNELINVYDMDGRNRPTYPFNRNLNYTGHIKSKLTTPSLTDQEKTTAYNKTIYKTLRDVGIKVDKQEGIINIVNSNLQATMDGLSSVEHRLDTEITDTYTKTQIQEIINGTSADGVTVTTVKSAAGTFDMNGLTIEQSEANTKTNINANGMIIYNKTGSIENDKLLEVNSDGVDAKNIKVSTYLNIGSHSRVEDYTDPSGETGTGIFWIGGGY